MGYYNQMHELMWILLPQGILIEKEFVCQSPHCAISFLCQYPLPKDLYFYHL